MKLLNLVKFVIFYVVFWGCQGLFAKILIIVPAYNSPDFIELQYKTFRKYLRDDYELVIFNDAKEQNECDQIETICKSLKITCVRIPQKIHELPYLERPSHGFSSWYQLPSVRNCNVVQYALNNIGFNYDDIVVLCESDLFLIEEFSIREYLKEFDLAGTLRVKRQNNHKVEYLWIGLIFLDMRVLPNKETFSVNCGYINDVAVDSGGYSYYYLKHNQNLRVNFFDTFSIRNLICNRCENTKSYRCTHNGDLLRKKKFNELAIRFIQNTPIDWGSGLGGVSGKRNIEFLLNKKFVHFFGGSGYASFSPYHKFSEFYKDKVEAFKSFIYSLLEKL